MPCLTRTDMFAQYELAEEPLHDFGVGGVPAQYASGHPKCWSSDVSFLDFAADAKAEAGAVQSYSSAISPDNKLLAIGTVGDRILIYDINSQELRQVLAGAGFLEFRPEVYGEESTTGEEKGSKTGRPAYTLVSGVSYKQSRVERRPSQLILWDLDQHGCTLDEEEPIDPDFFAQKAIEAITPKLVAKHEWTKSFIDASIMHKEFSETIRKTAADHGRRHNVIFDDAKPGGFGSSSFSSDGKLLLYHSTNNTTQHGMREASKLPHLVLFDIDAGKETYRLSGHTDAIMWSAFSFDGNHVASVSWDGTMRMYAVHTGELEWVTENSGGQSWAGAFSSDSRHIVWSSKSGRIVEVLKVADGQKVATFGGNFTNWCRCLAWHPTRNEIALCADKQAFIWSPFEGSDGKIWQHFQIGDTENVWLKSCMVEIHSVSWLDGGRLLGLEISEGSKIVYDTQSNTKELFKRPKGVAAAYVNRSLYGPLQTRDQADFYLSVDGDGKARYWRVSIPSYPSWWDKEKVSAEDEQRIYPETGKYVKVVKKVKGESQKGEHSQQTWAEKGADLWTAQ
ncbi:hypothetical protein ACN47E_003657 [Coniothyrium glycines]